MRPAVPQPQPGRDLGKWSACRGFPAPAGMVDPGLLRLGYGNSLWGQDDGRMGFGGRFIPQLERITNPLPPGVRDVPAGTF